MDSWLPSAAFLPAICQRNGFNPTFRACRFLCLAKGRGFGPLPKKEGKASNKQATKDDISSRTESSKGASGVLRTRTENAPDLSDTVGRKSNSPTLDNKFLEKVELVRRCVLEQKRTEEDRIYQPIDYDAPIEIEENIIGLGTKVGVGIAVVVFSLIFALGDFLPSASDVPSNDDTVVAKQISGKEKSSLEATLQQFEETLRKLPKDHVALEDGRK